MTIHPNNIAQTRVKDMSNTCNIAHAEKTLETLRTIETEITEVGKRSGYDELKWLAQGRSFKAPSLKLS